MLKSRWVTWNGVGVLYLDYAGFKQDIEGLRQEVAEADAEIQREPRGSVLVLIDLNDTVASGAVVSLFKDSSALTDPYVRRHALIGVSGMKRFLADKGDDVMLERAPLAEATAAGELMFYRHHGFWQCMDTMRDWELLNDLWAGGNAPWAVPATAR